MMDNVASLENCKRLYELSNPNGSSLKTCVDYLLGSKAWYSNKSVLTWKPLVTPSKRLLFQLSPSTPRTGETEFGLLRTPEAGDNLDRKMATNSRGELKLSGQVKMQSTEVKDWRIISMLKTPSASEAEGGAKVQDKYWNAKQPKFKMRDQIGRHTGLKLQPNFVEWMMGFPQNWTDLNYPSPNTERKD